jgi:hypothetical protein
LEKERIRQERILALEQARKEDEKRVAAAAAAAAAAKQQAEERKRQAEQKAREEAEKQKEALKAVPSRDSTSNPCELEFDAHLAMIEVLFKLFPTNVSSSQSSQMFLKLVRKILYGKKPVSN